VEASVDLSGVKVVHNPDPAAGRTGSLQAGVRALPPGVEAFFVHPVDVPLVGPADFFALQAARAEHGPEARFFVPTYAGRGGHPLLIDARSRDEVLVMGPDTPLRALLEAQPEAVRRIPVTNPGILVNVNTPEEYARSLDLYAAGRAVHAARPPQ
ncbi:MAG TPA: NTP transferase domain-containing protein, partial [Candidatus Thermoplasmatota archaeon]|nr:NTP transferase domain-containing protein [Candidatus Thermoplasmatota archaeon]